MADPPAVLCLPGPAFAYDYAAGELHCAGTPLFIHQEGGQGRGTAWAVWDAAVVCALWLDTPQARRALIEAGLPCDALTDASGVASDAAAAPPHRSGATELHVVELGAGTGLAGLAAAAALPGSLVTLTDLPDALPALARNVAANSALKDRVRVVPYDWTQPCPVQRADVVVAADCVWLRDLVAPFVAALDAACAAPRGVVLLVHQTRSSAVDEALWATLAAVRFAVAQQPQPATASCAQARVYILTRMTA